MSDEYNPFDRVNHSTNFEDYAIGSSLETNIFDKHQQTLSKITSITNTIDATKKDQLSNTFNKLYLKPHKFEPTIAKFAIGADAGRDSGTSSAEVTPATTPQNSPYTLRKMMDMNKQLATSNSAVANQQPPQPQKKISPQHRRWYSGFFVGDHTDGQQVGSGMTKNHSFKNLMVSNFDINAVGPTSW